MSAERRKHTRTKVPGMRVTFEDTSGQRADAEVLDIGAGGLFVRCDRPLPEGKGLTVELAFFGERDRLSARGRVAWVRPETGAGGPAGMGVRFVDVEATVLYRIEQLIALRERKESAAPVAAAPTRERTVLGVGWPQSAPKPALELPAARAATPSAPEPPPEEGWDAPSGDNAATKAEGRPTPPSEASLAAVGLPRRRRRRWPAVLFVLVAAVCAAYFMSERIPWLHALIDRGSAWISAQLH